MKLLGLALSKKRVIARILLFLYIGFIISITLLCREPGAKHQYNFELFWPWRKFGIQARQILLNILLFVPFGALLSVIIGNASWEKTILITVVNGLVLSSLIESSQLVFRLGLCELDDVFNNTLGTAIGVVLVLIFMKLKGKKMSHKPYGPYEKYFKRPIDLFCGLAAVIVFSWLYIILIILGAIFMRGNPFFTQERPGKDEKVFKLIKFRTMDNRKDKNGNLLPDEVRLNKYGRFLRKTSLDELPEAFNIIKGDMSVIGPRPLLVQYLPRYNEEQKHRHDVRPGLSGYAQVHGRNTVSWEDKFAMDVWYANHVTFLGDVKIIFQTVGKAFFKHEGISSETSATMEEFMGTPVGETSTWRAPN